MTIILNGTTGISDVDGSASTPAIRGTDTNTGIFFPAADTIAFAEGGVESARLDSNGDFNLGVNKSVRAYDGTIGSSNINAELTLASDPAMIFKVRQGGTANLTERMRIDSNGNVLVNKTASSSSRFEVSASNEVASFQNTGGTGIVRFLNSGATTIGTIQWTGSSTSYNTSSDYRLKENVAPMTGALAKVQALKPVTYKWKVDGSDGQGFIAHELAEVVPDCVTGEKDAVDENGNPVYQGIDTSFLVATLTAAIQEQQAIINELKTRIETLEQANGS